MRKCLKLAVTLLAMVPACALLGIGHADSRGNVWIGTIAAGGMVEMFFGLRSAASAAWKFWDRIFGPE